MLVNRKVWLGITLIASGGAATQALADAQDHGTHGKAGMAAAQGSEAGEGGEGGEGGDFPGGTFEHALKMMLAGEGGEGGLGLIKGEGMVSVPKLKGEQIKQVVSGNTLRTEYHVGYHFDESGTGEGFEIVWSKQDACAKEKQINGECWTSKTVKLPPSKWAVKGDTLCITPTLAAVTGPGSCVEVYMILNKVGLYSLDGKMVGKGSDLYAGRKLEEKVSR